MRGKVMQIALTTAALAGVAVGGAAIAGAATSNGGTIMQSSTGRWPPRMNMPRHGTAGHEKAEKAVTGAAATKAGAAAVKAAGGGTAGDVTTDHGGHGYEVTVTKSDGSTVEIHLDSSFTVVRGHGHCGGGGPPPGSAN